MKESLYEDAAMTYEPEESSAAGVGSAVERVRQTHEDELMAIDGVEGVGIGKNRIGDDAILVYLRHEGARKQIPRTIDGHPVEVLVTGPIDASSQRS